jgi:hypothetical protein
MNHSKPFLLLALGALAWQAAAQPAANVRLAAPVPTLGAVPKLQVVKPDGTRMVAAPVAIHKQVEWTASEQTVQQYLSRQGILVDQQTLDAFARMNPGVAANGVIPAQSRVSLYVPEWSARPPIAGGEPKAALDFAQIAKHSIRPEVTAVQHTRASALKLREDAFDKPGDFVAYQQATADLDRTAKLIEQRAPSLSSSELALSRYYLAAANTNAEAALNFNKSKLAIPSESVRALDTATANLRTMEKRLQSGQAPFSYREVTVVVQAEQAQQPTELRVYVLPPGIVNRPQTFGKDLVRELLVELAFKQRTTPSTGMAESGEMLLWVGPDHAYDAMAQLVVEQRLRKFVSLGGGTTALAQQRVELKSPSDVVNP